MGRATGRYTRVFLTGAVLLVTVGLSSPPSTASTAIPPGVQWAQRYNGSISGPDQASDVAVSPDGARVFVTGWSTSSVDGDLEWATVGYDATTGRGLWSRLYAGAGTEPSAAKALTVAPDGSRVYVTGYGAAVSSTDYVTIAYDAATGTPLWLGRYNGPGHSTDTPAAIAATPDGTKVLVTGSSFGDGSSDDYATVAYDAATGARSWVRRFNGVMNEWDQAVAIAVTPDGQTAFVTGSAAMRVGGSDYVTIALSTDSGTIRWGRDYNRFGDSYDAATAIAVSPDGSRVFVTGDSSGFATGTDDATIAYDARTGASLWTVRFDANRVGDGAAAITTSPDGGSVFITGFSASPATRNDFATVAYSADTGMLLWSAFYGGVSNDVAAGIALSPDGSYLYVTGYTNDGSTDNYATVAYDPSTGTEVGVRTIDGAGHGADHANAVVATQTQVFITGESYSGLEAEDDYLTAAYAI